MKASVVKLSPFLLTGALGFGLAIVLCSTLVWLKHLNWIPYFIMLFTTIFAFVFMAFTKKIINGVESYVLYHDLLFSIGCVSLALFISNAPILSYLDIYVCGFGLFHIFGRIGCHKTGCCHGRPSSFGHRYTKKYLNTGFPKHYIDVIVFPSQLAEAIGILCLTSGCLFLLFSPDYLEGIVFTWYLSWYASLRYVIEFTRGDTDRPYFLGLSEAQWISLLLLTFICIGGVLSWWPSSQIQTYLAPAFITISVVLFLFRLFKPEFEANTAKHIDELNAISIRTINSGNPPTLYTTSLGIKMALSAGENGQRICSLSYSGKANAEKMIELSFRNVQKTRFPGKTTLKKKGNNGVYHFIIEK